jgi:predicted phage-related endonuclease
VRGGDEHKKSVREGLGLKSFLRVDLTKWHLGTILEVSRTTTTEGTEMEKTVNSVTAEAISQLAQVRKAIKELQEQESALRDSVIEGLGDNSVAVFRGQQIARLTQVTRVTVDSKKLQEQFPEAFEATKRESTSPRLTLV